MDRNTVDWHGYIPAITTPFTREGALDATAFEGQMQWLAEQGMHGVILAGTSGEWFSMTEAERAELFALGGRFRADMRVIGGCNAFTAAEAIRHAHAAEEAGLDGILVTPPPYMVPTREEIVAFYQEISDGTTLPITVYNWPRGCIVDLSPDLLGELADIENVVAIKNSTGDFRAFLDAMYLVEDRVRYFGVPTNALGADLVSLGHGDGLMGSGAPLGRDHPGFWDALAAGDRARAVELGARDRVVMTSWFGPDYGAQFGNQQAIMKTALRLQGVPAGFVRRPLLELSEEQVDRVRATLEGLGITTVPLS
ncbi:dihydrodipicolinate synthase family protein [Microbacterium sp. NPDC028030]|uniref:dihydrodipicolinate synthase family protein n=1 Tax=Microbacterium sp. NPDC028030 TaxID=3155124 RepID=UPI0033E38547